ncbi:MAG: hypothetical protein ACYDCL_15110 [Myxococcales bacterium]
MKERDSMDDAKVALPECCTVAVAPRCIHGAAFVMAAVLLAGALTARAQCTKDTDCKGDRVCGSDGHCVAPQGSGATNVGPASPYTAPAYTYPPQPPAQPQPVLPPQVQPPPAYGSPQQPYASPPPYGGPPPQQYAPPQPSPFVPYVYHPVLQPRTPSAATVRFIVSGGLPVTTYNGFGGSSQKTMPNDIAHYRVTVTMQQGGSYSCESMREQPCSLDLPLGQAHAHFDVVLGNDDTKQIDKDFVVDSPAPKVAELTYASHKVGRIVGWILFPVAEAVAVPLLVDGASNLNNTYDGTTNPVALAELIVGICSATVGLSLGLALGLNGDTEQLDVSTPGFTDDRMMDASPGDALSAREVPAVHPMFGIVPIRDGAMLSAGLTF